MAGFDPSQGRCSPLAGWLAVCRSLEIVAVGIHTHVCISPKVSAEDRSSVPSYATVPWDKLPEPTHEILKYLQKRVLLFCLPRNISGKQAASHQAADTTSPMRDQIASTPYKKGFHKCFNDLVSLRWESFLVVVYGTYHHVDVHVPKAGAGKGGREGGRASSCVRLIRCPERVLSPAACISKSDRGANSSWLWTIDQVFVTTHHPQKTRSVGLLDSCLSNRGLDVFAGVPCTSLCRHCKCSGICRTPPHCYVVQHNLDMILDLWQRLNGLRVQSSHLWRRLNGGVAYVQEIT